MYRVLKKDCLDLPPKVYERRYVELTPQQRKLYNEVATDFMAEMGGKIMSAALAMTRLMRLQQITGGFFKPNDDAEPIEIPGGNPKLDDVMDVAEQTAGKMIIWARFTAELRLIANTLEKEYGSSAVARYWGEISNSQRDKRKKAFETDPACRYFVAQAQAGGTGLDGLQIADTVHYFSNDFSLITRLQSEDRAHRGGSEIHDKVTLIDSVAEDTNDIKILDTLRDNQNVADAITGDDPRKWI